MAGGAGIFNVLFIIVIYKFHLDSGIKGFAKLFKMGLMLSILVVCVGVIEALSCFEHFQYGVIHCAMNVYEHARRRSSILLKYTSRRSNLLSENSFDEEPEIETRSRFAPDSVNRLESNKELSETDFSHFSSVKKQKPVRNILGPVKKLDNDSKIQIVKSLLEKPSRPKTIRSISMPELTHTERDIELTKIINHLAIEPIEEINIEIEDENYEVLTEEFDKLFDEHENPFHNSESLLKEFNLDLKPLEGVDFSVSPVENFERSTDRENDTKKFLQNLKPDELLVKDSEYPNEIKLEKTKSFKEVIKNSIDQRVSDKGAEYFKEAIIRRGSLHKNRSSRSDRSASVDFSEILSLRVNKSHTVDLDVFPETKSDSDGFVNKSLLDESISDDESVDTILENETPPVEVIDKTFEEIYENVCSEFLESYEEIESILNDKINLKTKNFNGDFIQRGSVPLGGAPQVNTTLTEIKSHEDIKSRQDLAVPGLPEGASISKIFNKMSIDTKNKNEPSPVVNASPKKTLIEATLFLKAVEQLAELMAKDALNLKKIKNFLSKNINVKEKSNSTENDLGKVDIQLGKGQLINTPVTTDLVVASECLVQSENVKNLIESKNDKDENVSQEILKDNCLEKENVKAPLAVKEDRANVPHEVYEKCQKDLSLLDSITPKVFNVKSEKHTNISIEPENIISAQIHVSKILGNTDILRKTTEQKDNLTLLDSAVLKELKIPLKKIDPPNEVVGEPHKYCEILKPKLVEDLVNQIFKDVFENIPKTPLEGKGGKNKLIEQKTEIRKLCNESEDRTHNAADVVGDKNNTFTSRKNATNLENIFQEETNEPAAIHKNEMNVKKEIQSEQDNKTVHADSDILSESIQPDARKQETLLALEYKAGINLKENEKEKKVEIVSKKAEALELAGIIAGATKQMDSDVKIEESCFNLHTKVEELEEDVKFEQVGKVEAEQAENLHAEPKNIEKANIEPEESLENEEKHSSDSKCDKKMKATSSAPEAFWLIFSGEYTKAMSKDWHSGHFSCWQCDEALTGQRYVLRDDHPYCIKCYESVFANVCEECNKIIGIDSKDLSYKDKHWHEACFLCNKCRVSLVDKQFGSKADKIYCGNCYDAQFASRCDGCGEIFRAGTKKMEYKTRQWHEKCFCCCVCKTPIGTKSFIPREQEIYCATCYEEKFATRCVKCNKIITSGGVTYKNEPWHRECFNCTNCNTSLAGQRFTSRDEKPYCADCFGELFAKRCTACSRPITGIGGTRFISFEDRHWHNDCFICASCNTSLVGRGFITDGDDIICPECAKQKLM